MSSIELIAVVARMGELRNAYESFVGNPKEKGHHLGDWS
jgi:hypothetical protein